MVGDRRVRDNDVDMTDRVTVLKFFYGLGCVCPRGTVKFESNQVC